METACLAQMEFFLRVVLAGVCGGLIGYERNNRLKEAGMRTHGIVSLASALLMIVSKHGFDDLLGMTGVGLDPSRVAAQIVSGVGFLGAGMIFVRGGRTVSGLTTAAGIWGTAGIGMAIGAGLYFLGAAATLMIYLIQTVLHKKQRWFHFPAVESLRLMIKNERDAVGDLKAEMVHRRLDIMEWKAENLDNGYIEVKLAVILPYHYHILDFIGDLNENPAVKSVERETKR